MFTAKVAAKAPISPFVLHFHVVSRYVQSYVKPGMKMTEICQRLERKTHELVVACLAALDSTSLPNQIYRSFSRKDFSNF